MLKHECMNVPGVRIATFKGGVKKADRADMLVFELCEGATVSGVFTQNAFCAAPVILAKKYLSSGSVRALVVNSGNANACTGERGLQDAERICEGVAEALSFQKEQVLPFSTGVIGEYLPVENMLSALPAVPDLLSDSAWALAARAIMTTDTKPKMASAVVDLDGTPVVVSGIAKGAGMICPNMATMLSFVATDAAVDSDILNAILRRAAHRSFNRITIDGDTSTNDACMLMATGRSGAEKITSLDSPAAKQLESAVVDVMAALAQAIVRDGEGATKFVTVQVSGGESEAACLKVAYAIAHSPLVKTALYASDANWGRIVAAIGYADLPGLDARLVKVWLDDVLIVEQGHRAASYEEALGAKVVSQQEFTIRVDLGRGDSEEIIWTSDLSHEYVTINAEYRS